MADLPDRFDTAHLVQTMGRRVAIALFTVYGAQAARILITLGGMAALARLLTPEDFGKFGLATAFTGIATIVVDLGFSSATTQREKIDQNIVSALFYLNVVAGVVMAAVLCLLTPFLGQAFHQPGIQPLLAGMSLMMILTSSGSQHRALLIREMRFPLLGAIDLVALGIGTAVAIVLAFATSLGAWCLVATQLIWSLCSTLAFWHFSRWRPSRTVNWRGARGELIFGGRVTFSSLLSYFGRQSDKLLIGYFSGAAQLGQYTRAYGLMLLPMGFAGGPLTGVITPALSRVQSYPERWRSLYLQSLGLLVFLTVPIATAIFFLSDEITLIVLGPRWNLAARLLRLFAVGMFIEPLITASAWSLFSFGRMREYLNATLLTTFLMLASFVIGIRLNGAAGVAAGYSVTLAALLVPRVWHALRNTPVSLTAFAREIAPQVAGAILAAAAVLATRHAGWSPAGAVPRVAIIGSIIGLSYLAGFVLAAAAVPGEFRWPRLAEALKGRKMPWRP